MHLEDKPAAMAELTEAQREQAMARFRILRPHTLREEFRFQERRKQQAWGYELWSDGLPSIVPMAWLDWFGKPVRTADAESCRRRQLN